MTVDYGDSFQGTMGGQPKEAAAWVAYANANAGIYGTANDVALGLDAEGNNSANCRLLVKLSRVDRPGVSAVVPGGRDVQRCV